MSRAEGYFTPEIHCDQGHLVPITAATCPVCRNAIAVITNDLLDQLNQGLLLALEPDPLIGRTHAETETLRLLAEDRLTKEW